MPRSTAMAMVGHQTEAIYRRYAIADESMLRDGGAQLEALHVLDAQAASSPPVVVPLEGRYPRHARHTGGTA